MTSSSRQGGLFGAGLALALATRHSISLAQLPHGWTWELIDADGATAAAGVAGYQEAVCGRPHGSKRFLKGAGDGSGAAVCPAC